MLVAVCCDSYMNEMDTLPSSSIDVRGFQQLFKEALPTLQDIASSTIAISLWYNSSFAGTLDECEVDSFLNRKCEEVKKSLENFNLPRLIQDLIKISILKVNYETEVWIEYMSSYINSLPGNEIIILPRHLECIVWKSGSEIDYRQSAQNMLYLDDLSETKKFFIKCKYYLENELKNLTPNAELESFFAEVDFGRSPPLFYWICYVKNELGKVPVDANSESLENFMITQNKVNNWYGIEYFWNRLNEQDQITRAAELLTNWSIAKFQKQFLSKMNDFQLREVFSRIPVDIVVNFWIRLGEPETAFTIWIRIKNLLSGEQFSALVEKILDERGYSEEYIPLMVRLWDSAEDYHKRYLIYQKKEIIIKYYFTYTVSMQQTSLKFLYTVLSYSSPRFRQQIILERGDNLVGNNHFSEVDKIIKLCLPNDNEVIEFKKLVMKSTVVRNHCDRLFQAGEFDYFNKLVEFYSSDGFAIKDYQRLIVDSNNIKIYSIFSSNKWTEVETLVDDVYSDTELAKSVKQRLILAYGNEMWCLYDILSNLEALHQLINVIDRYLTHENIAKLKDKLLGSFRRILFYGTCWTHKNGWRSVDETCWNKFLFWCLGSEEKIKQFKSTLPIDEVFDQILIYIRWLGCPYDPVKGLLIVDNFLRWCLVNAEEVKKYKLRRIFSSSKYLKIIERLIAKNKLQYSKILLTFFLGNDEEQIRKFKFEFSNSKISLVI